MALFLESVHGRRISRNGFRRADEMMACTFRRDDGMHNAKSRVWKRGDDRQATMGTSRRAWQTGKGFLAWQI